jgi:hypothetical protein
MFTTRTQTLSIVAAALLLPACAATVIGEHRMIDEGGTEYTLKQDAINDEAGPMILTSKDGKFRCEGTARTRSTKGTYTPTTNYIKDKKTGQMIPVAGTQFNPGPVMLSANLRCNDGKLVRCEGEQKIPLFSTAGRFVGECKHPDRGTIYEDGKVR